MRMLSEVLNVCDNEEDKFMLELVMLVECVLKPTGRYIDWRSFSMVDDLEEFLAYP